MSENSLIRDFLAIISGFTDNSTLVHRARVLKTLSEKNNGSHLKKREKEALWKKVIDEDYIVLDQRGNIVGLSDQANLILKNTDARGG